MPHPDFVKRCLPPRAANSHKGTYGTLVSICGSYGMAGAAMFAARAASRSGVGLVKAVLPDTIYPIVATAVPEAVFVPLADSCDKEQTMQILPHLAHADALLIGCGLGQALPTAKLLSRVLQTATCPIILDADGINLAAQHIVLRETVRSPLILTPHPMELARLLHSTVERVQADREGAALAAAQETGAIVVLKGHRTVVASAEHVLFVNSTGNAGMATAGMGDVLAGMIAGLVAQGVCATDAACGGVYLHGLAGDKAALRLSKRALLPSDVLDELKTMFSEWE